MTGLRTPVVALLGVGLTAATISVTVVPDALSEGDMKSDIDRASIAARGTVHEDMKLPHHGIEKKVSAHPRAEDRPDWPFISDEGELLITEKASAWLAREMIYLDVIGQADAGDRSILTDFKNRLSPRFRFEFINYHLQYEEDFKTYSAAQSHTHKEAQPPRTSKPSMSLLEGVALLTEVMNQLKPPEQMDPRESMGIVTRHLVYLDIVGQSVRDHDLDIVGDYVGSLSSQEKAEFTEFVRTLKNTVDEYVREHPGMTSGEVLNSLFVPEAE